MDVWIAIVTLAGLLVYGATVVLAGRARGRYGIEAPAMTGHPVFERAVRVQANTLEWLVIFIPSLWLFARYTSAPIGATVGAVWVVGRIVYLVGYMQAPGRRAAGFLMQALATLVLLLGALGGVAARLVHTGIHTGG